jgi:hypothetical protein
MLWHQFAIRLGLALILGAFMVNHSELVSPSCGFPIQHRLAISLASQNGHIGRNSTPSLHASKGVKRFGLSPRV